MLVRAIDDADENTLRAVPEVYVPAFGSMSRGGNGPDAGVAKA